MSKWDDEYIKLCKKILNDGFIVENRTGTNTIKIPSYNLHFDLAEEYPFLTTKQLYHRQAILEMLWIWQVQSNDVRWLQERDVRIWDEWKIDENGYWHATQNVLNEDGKLKKEKIKKYFGKEYAHTIGEAYGYIMNKYKKTDEVLDKIINKPHDRRNIVNLYQEIHLDKSVLPPCVYGMEFDVTDGKLNSLIHQRSCDVPLGLPFNVTQYATLVNLLAHVSNLKPGTMDWSIKDAHIYLNQLDGIQEQINRYDKYGSYPAPELWLNQEVKDFYDFDNSKDLKDIKVLKYKHMGKIDFPISQ